MPDQSWTAEQLEGFREAAQSLKLYRRAELEDELHHKSLIKDLYVDPLPAQHVFRTILRPNTTFLIGRKGTGKSTIFQRLQYELRHTHGHASAYVDIKTAFEESAADPALISQLGPDTLGGEEIRRLRLYRAFIKAVINAIKEQIIEKLKESAWEWVKNIFTESADTLFESLDDLIERADAAEFHSVLGIRREALQGDSEEEHYSEATAKVEGALGPQIRNKD
jgi:energy-coupling factor transporter ATP-binding protein EcfA2